jgi:hypothetical protein
MEFKKLEVEPESNWLKRVINSRHNKKTFLYIIIGAVGGLLYFYFTEGVSMDYIDNGEIIKSMLFGAFLGFFMTNSPCARGRC